MIKQSPTEIEIGGGGLWGVFLFFFLKKSKPQAEQNLKGLWQDEVLKTPTDLESVNSNYFTFLALLYCVPDMWKSVED